MHRDVMKISGFKQVGVDIRETETNRKEESPTFDEERKDREIKKNKSKMIRSCSILFAKFSVSTFHYVSASFPNA